MREHTEESASSSIQDLHGDTAVTIRPLADDTHAGYWQNIEAAMADEAEYRATHCESCGGVTPGTIVAGTHIQQCDGCLSKALRETLALIESQAA